MLFIYFELYWSIKKLTVNNSVVSMKKLVLINSVAFIFLLILGASGFAFMDVQNDIFSFENCLMTCNLYTLLYRVIIQVIFSRIFIIIMVFHIKTIRILKSQKAKHVLNVSNSGWVSTNTCQGWGKCRYSK